MRRPEGRTPSFVVIGTAKGGTTSLHHYLSLHPDIHMARPKETRFFVDSPVPAGRWSLGLDWYKSLFRSDKKITGEASPSYSAFPDIPGVVEKMRDVIPQARFIYLVREPFARLRSSYLMDSRLGGTEKSLAGYLQSEPLCMAGIRYGTQIKNYLRFFGSEQILVIESAQLHGKRRETLDGICSFLGAGPMPASVSCDPQLNTGKSELYPRGVGQRIVSSKLMVSARNKLPSQVYSALRKGLLLPFSGPPPSTELPREFSDQLTELLREEMDLLRDLSGLDLPSLNPVANC